MPVTVLSDAPDRVPEARIGPIRLASLGVCEDALQPVEPMPRASITVGTTCP